MTPACRTILAVLLWMAVSFPAAAQVWRDSESLTTFFETTGEDVTFVVYDSATATLTGYNRHRAFTRFTPASTFKIPHSVIGLSVGAVRDVDDPLPYDGKPARFKTWEKDMGLREAIRVSNLPAYQELARRIGPERMRAELGRIDYGNNEIGEGGGTFWLNGPLTISAVEQVRFLARLAEARLPQPEAAQKAVRDILRVEDLDDGALYAKTGLALRQAPGVGWWVGWVERAGTITPFALNMAVTDMDIDGPKRSALGREALTILGVIAE